MSERNTDAIWSLQQWLDRNAGHCEIALVKSGPNVYGYSVTLIGHGGKEFIGLKTTLTAAIEDAVDQYRRFQQG